MDWPWHASSVTLWSIFVKQRVVRRPPMQVGHIPEPTSKCDQERRDTFHQICKAGWEAIGVPV